MSDNYGVQIEKLEASLDAESKRHDFTLSKWMQERKELTDALVKTRTQLESAMGALEEIGLLDDCYDGEYAADVANKALEGLK